MYYGKADFTPVSSVTCSVTLQTVRFDKFNASLFILKKKNLTDPNLLNDAII